MVNRYQGNTGRVTRIREPQSISPGQGLPQSKPQKAKPVGSCGQSSSAPVQGGILSQLLQPTRSPAGEKGKKPEKGLGALLQRLDPSRLEFEDILLMLILYLLYRDSGDEELLIMLGAMLLL